MKTKTYSIFGAGAAGLYTAWRLLNGTSKTGKESSSLLSEGDTLELYDWGHYNLADGDHGTRAPGARVCTWHHRDDKSNSYIELGGMRYMEWDGSDNGGGHRLVTQVIEQLGLKQYSVPFTESGNPLYYLRSKNLYNNAITSSSPAPYSVNNYGADAAPGQGFTIVQDLALGTTAKDYSRRKWDQFYQAGVITSDLADASIFQKGDPLRNIGYWNLMYDQLGSEGFDYTSDGNGYSSNVINWNSAIAMQSNNEFAPGTPYKTLTTGYSSMFKALFDDIVGLAREKGVRFEYRPNRRLHSILKIDKLNHFNIATREQPNKKASSGTCDAAWLAMPRYAIELVAQATRFDEQQGLDVLNHRQVQLYLESVIMQPSYKIGMFFDKPWWETATYPPQLTGYEVTTEVIAALAAAGFPNHYLTQFSQTIVDDPAPIMNTPYDSSAALTQVLEARLDKRLSVAEERQILAAAKRNTIGPSYTDTPIRMAVYFGNNALDQKRTPVYGLLAAYDDETFTTFWQELELEPSEDRKTPISENTEPLKGPRKVPTRMLKMLRRQLAELHFGPNATYTSVPEPLEAKYVDWSLPPFNAGYHAWAAHFDIADVQRKIRKPSQLIGEDANIFIVGEAYSNDQAWVEGAYCTAESVLNDFFDVEPLIKTTHYPFICCAAAPR